MKSLGIRDIKFFIHTLEWAKQDRLAFVDAYNKEEKVVVEAKEDIIKIEKMISKLKFHLRENKCAVPISIEEQLRQYQDYTFKEIKEMCEQGIIKESEVK